MTPQTLNLLYSVALILAIVGAGIYQLLSLVFHGSADSKITDIIVTLMGLLMAFRHAADLKNGNGSSGTNLTSGANDTTGVKKT
jgi:hypothetical protein